MDKEFILKAAAEAVQYMSEEIHRPAFFAKLASLGIVPKTEKQKNNLLKLGALLQAAELQDIQDENRSVLVKKAMAVADDNIALGKLSKVASEIVEENKLAKVSAIIYSGILG